MAGSAVKEAGARFRRLGARVGARFGDAPTRSVVRSPDRGGGRFDNPDWHLWHGYGCSK
jgi:hypothetical protein